MQLMHRNWYVRKWEPGSGYSAFVGSTPKWIERTNTLVAASYEMVSCQIDASAADDHQASNKIRRLFPGDPAADALLKPETRAFVLEFARAAMRYQWTRSLDSFDEAPPLLAVDVARFLDRYIPSPDELPPLCFTKADPYGRHADAPEHIWLDSDLRPVPASGQDTLSAKACSPALCTAGSASTSSSSPPS